VQRGPLSSVVDFLELIGAELDHTPKRGILPSACSTCMQIYIKFGAREVFV
jgi:hypothetical protein